jgi:hypothetical protein
MKQQLAEMQPRSAEISSLKKEMAKLESENAKEAARVEKENAKEMTKVETENARLTAENKKLADTLASVQGENKTLSTKLVAARSSAPADTRNVPGSAVKPRITGVVLPGTAEANKEAQLQKQKIELYSDLTNLIVLGYKKNEDAEEIYDCLQAGRNGSKHTPSSLTPLKQILILLSSSTLPAHCC